MGNFSHQVQSLRLTSNRFRHQLACQACQRYAMAREALQVIYIRR